MIHTELINRILTSIQTNDKEEVLRLLAIAKEDKDPILNLYYLEALFWIRNTDLNRARTSLFKELLRFPQNSKAAKLFILLQPVSQSPGSNQRVSSVLHSIGYLQDDVKKERSKG